jgi:trypsin-like peptidase
MPHDFEKSIVRIHHQQGGIVGAGFLTIGRQVVTCAHVISNSFGFYDVPPEAPAGDIRLDFPLIPPAHFLIARVIAWQPDNDVALLQIIDDLPPQVHITSLFKFHDITAHEFHVYGFPEGRDYGLWSFGRILGPNARGYIQIESETSHTVRQGFSGSLVWDATRQQIVGIIIEADRNAKETQTAYFLPINAIIDSFPQLETTSQQEDNGIRYACFISYPNDMGIQGQLVREFAESINSALAVELGGLFDKPIFFDKEHMHENNDLARAMCESACFLMIFTPKYFNEKTPLCTLEYKAMQELESRRLGLIDNVPKNMSFIIPVRPYSRDILPMNVIGQRQDYDFHEMTLTGNLRAHQQYGPLVRQLAEHIFKCYQLLENCSEDSYSECSEFRLPALDQVRDLFRAASPKKFAKFPIR